MEERILAHLLYISINITTEIIVLSFILKDIVYPYTLTSLELFSILTILRMYLLIYFYVQQCSVYLYTMCEPGIYSPEDVSAGAGKTGPLKVVATPHY